jgi:hypothetical protein
MTAEVDIWNMSLAAMGHKAFVQSPTENSVEARYCNLFYEPARKATLRLHPWNFARGRKLLTLIGDGTDQWTYQYALPNGCLKARFIVPALPNIKEPFEIGLNDAGTSRVLYTNKEEAVLIFTHNVVNPDLFDPMFVEAFHLNLSQKLSPTIAPNKSQEMLTKFVNAMRQAQTSDASEGLAEDVSETDWLEARVSGTVITTRTVE